MPPGLRKVMLTVHLMVSVGWIGAVVAYVALGVSAVTSQEDEMVRATWIAMGVTGWSVIVLLALAALLTGIVMVPGTPWGVFRHHHPDLGLLVLRVIAGLDTSKLRGLAPYGWRKQRERRTMVVPRT